MKSNMPAILHEHGIKKVTIESVTDAKLSLSFVYSNNNLSVIGIQDNAVFDFDMMEYKRFMLNASDDDAAELRHAAEFASQLFGVELPPWG